MSNALCDLRTVQFGWLARGKHRFPYSAILEDRRFREDRYLYCAITLPYDVRDSDNRNMTVRFS